MRDRNFKGFGLASKPVGVCRVPMRDRNRRGWLRQDEWEAFVEYL